MTTPEPIALQVITAAGAQVLDCGCTVDKGQSFAVVSFGDPPRAAVSFCLPHLDAVANRGRA